MRRRLHQSAALNSRRDEKELQTRDFERIYRSGRRRRSDALVVIARRRPSGKTRFGISVKAELGNAVLRNRLKRRLREILRQQRWQLPGGWDVVVEPRRPELARMEFAQLAAELETLLQDTLANENQE